MSLRDKFLIPYPFSHTYTIRRVFAKGRKFSKFSFFGAISAFLPYFRKNELLFDVKTPHAIVKSSSDVVKTPHAMMKSSCDVVKTPHAMVFSSSDVVKTPHAMIISSEKVGFICDFPPSQREIFPQQVYPFCSS